MLSTRVRIDESENSATLSADRLTLRLSDGQVLEIPIVAVTFLGYTREAIPDDTLIGVPTLVAPIPVFYMGWLRKAGLHYVAIDYTRTDGGTARVLLQADKKNYVQMLTALSASTGIRVSMPQADRKHFRKEFAAQELNQPLRRVPGIAAWRVELLTGHRKGVTSVAFSADGRMLASGLDDGTVLVWDVASRKIMWASPRQGRGGTEIAFGPGGKLLASWNIFKSNVTVWDVGTHTMVADIDGARSAQDSRCRVQPGRADAGNPRRPFLRPRRGDPLVATERPADPGRVSR